MLNITSVKSARQNFTNLRQIVSIKIRSNILPYVQLRFINASSTVLSVILHSSERSWITKRKICRSPLRTRFSLANFSDHYNLCFIIIKDAYLALLHRVTSTPLSHVMCFCVSFQKVFLSTEKKISSLFSNSLEASNIL